jgi:hypothetical protein
MKNISIFLFCISFLYSCTDNQRARSFGGTQKVKLNPCEKFISATWKADELWLVLQDTCSGEFKFREKSSFGLIEGEVIIK